MRRRGRDNDRRNLSFYLGEELKRHTILFDPDIYTGSAAMMLGGRCRHRPAAGAGNAVTHRRAVRRAVGAAGFRTPVVLAGDERSPKSPTLPKGRGGRCSRHCAGATISSLRTCRRHRCRCIANC
ncbi:MAG: hypothetical protein WDN04_06275 [Rhodospirillales bacterium]